MNRLREALELGLRLLDEGKSLDDVLSMQPELRPELAPLLRAALRARQAGRVDMPPAARQRLRAQFLRRASELRDARRTRRVRVITPFPRIAITIGLVVLLVLTSTGLVRASSSAVPGDELYTVKRSWEDIRLLLSAQPTIQYMLASEFEQERLNEIDELLARGRAAPVIFSGVVSFKSDGEWIISGIPVQITSATILPAGNVKEGQPVLVTGTTRGAGQVEVDSIQLLLPGAALPPLAPSVGAIQQGSETGHENPAPSGPPEHLPSQNPPAYITYEFTGLVEKMGVSVWQVNQQQIMVEGATIIGTIKVGSEIKFEGYFKPDGSFIASRIEPTANLNHDDGRDTREGKTDTQTGSDSEADSVDGEPEADH